MTKYYFAGGAISLAAFAALAACTPKAPAAAPAADTAAVATAVKADVAQLVTAINAHDATKVGSHDAPDVVVMFHGAPNAVDPAADVQGMKQALADPAFKVTLLDETVDVPASADMAVYRATYNQDFTDPKAHKVMTAKVNYLAGYKKQADGTWKIEWYVVSDISTAPAATPAPASH